MKKIKFEKSVKIIALFLLFTLFIGCGYAFAPQGEYVDKRIQKIYVEPFGNKTPQAEIENFVRTAFINNLIQYSRFKVVGSAAQADATIKGTVRHYNAETLSYRANKLAAEERISATLEVVFRDKENDKVLWSSSGIRGTVEYDLEDNINLIPIARKNALIKLANDTAEKAVNLMLAGF
jgi:outer membrane lipopolysaccharide assembly protein LptE/RlpB